LKSYSSLIGVVSLVLQVRERGERAGSESVELVLEEHDFLFLLLDDVEELALVGDLLDSLGGIGSAVLVGVGLEAHDLLPLVHVLLELACLVIELLVLEVLLSDLTLQLRLRHIERLDSLGCVGFELLDLALEPLLVFLVPLLVLTLDDLLRGLGHTVQLHILGALDEVADLQPQALVLVLDPLQVGVVRQDLPHVVDLLVATVLDLGVFLQEYSFTHQNGVLVIGCDWELRHFDLPLLKVDDDLEVELELFITFSGLSTFDLGAIEFVSDGLLLAFQMANEVPQMAQALVALLQDLVHPDAEVALVDDLVELLS